MNTPKGEESVFTEAFRPPAAERAAYIARATVDNPALRQEVESLLHGYATGDFLEVAPASQLRPTLHAAAPLTVQVDPGF